MKYPLTFMILVCFMVACIETGTMIHKRTEITEQFRRTLEGDAPAEPVDPSDQLPLTRTTVTETTVEMPANNKEKSTVTVDNETGASIGAAYPDTEDEVAKTQTKISTNWSIAIGVVAVALFAAHRYSPLIPSQLPIGLGILAGILFIAPTIIDRYSKEIAICCGGWLVWTIYSARHNHKLKREDPRKGGPIAEPQEA